MGVNWSKIHFVKIEEVEWVGKHTNEVILHGAGKAAQVFTQEKFKAKRGKF